MVETAGTLDYAGFAAAKQYVLKSPNPPGRSAIIATMSSIVF